MEVQEDDEVGVPLRMHIVDVEPSRSGTQAPIDASGAVPGLVEPDVGELDAVTSTTGQLVAAEHLGLGSREGSSERLGPRVDTERLPIVERALETKEAQPIVSSEEGARAGRHPPPRRAQS